MLKNRLSLLIKKLAGVRYPKLLLKPAIRILEKIWDIDHRRFETKEWKEFYDLLTKDIPPCLACLETCGTKTDGTPIMATREDTHYDKEGNIVDYEKSTYSQRYTKEKK